MILYNVTCNVERDRATEWLDWMLKTHIPEVMATGCFLSHLVMRLLNNAEDDEGVNIVIQYTATDMAQYEKYQSEFGPALREKTLQRYGEAVIAFRSLLEVIEG
jgi:hypothetical protein